MKGKRHTPDQIIAKLREADAMLGTGATIGQVCQKFAVTEATFHCWRNQYGGMKGSDAKRLKELEQGTPSSRGWWPSRRWRMPCSRKWPRETGKPGASA